MPSPPSSFLRIDVCWGCWAAYARGTQRMVVQQHTVASNKMALHTAVELGRCDNELNVVRRWWPRWHGCKAMPVRIVMLWAIVSWIWFALCDNSFLDLPSWRTSCRKTHHSNLIMHKKYMRTHKLFLAVVWWSKKYRKQWFNFWEYLFHFVGTNSTE